MPATTLAPNSGRPAQQDPANAAPAALVPFTRAAYEHVETFLDVTQALGGSGTSLGPIDVPAYGFARGIWIEVEATGGSGTVAVAQPDAPFSVFDAITLSDVNGAPIFGPVSGYETMLVNKFGGYNRGKADPKSGPDYIPVATSGYFKFLLYVPLEINGRDALGALANMNGSSTYKLRLDIAPTSRIFSTVPTTLPTLRIRASLDAWSQPTAADLRGFPQATTPPATGTTQYWSKQVFNVNAGQQILRDSRVGNYFRNKVLIFRDSSGARNSLNFPSPLDIMWDSRLMKSQSPTLWRQRMAHRYGYTGTPNAADAMETGVFVEDYMHEFDGLAGYELRDGWLPTTQATRFEYQGTFGSAGTLTVLTNDVSPAGEIFVG